jgi:hypothetical protein
MYETEKLLSLGDAVLVLLNDPRIRRAIDPKAYDQIRDAMWDAIPEYAQRVPPMTEEERDEWIARSEAASRVARVGIAVPYQEGPAATMDASRRIEEAVGEAGEVISSGMGEGFRDLTFQTEEPWVVVARMRRVAPSGTAFTITAGEGEVP